ncbi:MAG TPA: hypothetical protein PKW18_06625 [Candidatus Sumerlaeota bacterium]|nr:hypothetical protein [Candidatus Sumerlaeota bacterium]HON49606.1 hypothetical protein [Candidatus Sumerlaeota bacterium]HOR64758.1 hypothetical protein [Candidatus Sumerlaeota bacterium]HPL74231.1 hypothetical protein [Candidatus Sumerlaeota bacterium]HRU54842.1 hypothetical protein [Candidatus Sumerlaeia bacterium]
MKNVVLAFALCLSCALSVFAQNDSVPNIIHYQGQLREGNLRYEGSAIFRFAIIDNTTPKPLILWSNDGTQTGKTADNVPLAGVTLAVSKGLFDVRLGDAGVAGMSPIPVQLFANKIIYLRVWFQKNISSDIELLSPDARLVAVPFAFRSGSINGKDIDDSSIPMGKLGRESVGPENEGRSNTIQSVCFNAEVSPSSSYVIYNVPAGKTFVLTDIYIANAANYCIWTITDHATSHQKQNIKWELDARLPNSIQNAHYSFRAGIRFESPKVVAIFPQNAVPSVPIRGTISGFEFTTPTN